MLHYTLDANKRGVEVSRHLYGLFFEDINHAADGGLNAEMIVNNSFEFSYYTYDGFAADVPVSVRAKKDAYWDICGAGRHEISTEGGMNENNPSYLLLEVGGRYRIENPGYFVTEGSERYGMPVREGERYDFSVYVKRLGFKGSATFFLEDARGRCTAAGRAEIPAGGEGDWVKIAASAVAERSTMARFCFLLEGNGTLGLDYFSLLPATVWGDPEKYRNGKLSPRIVKAIADCHPSFLRFPGGCVVEGDVDFPYQYRWRDTVGPLEQRRQIPNVWGYLQSYGIGFYEYFCLCEDLGMAPLPVLHCGLLCQMRMGEQRKTGYRRILPDTEEFEKEVIGNVADLIFFAKGDASSEDENERRWALLRAEMGHPDPFPLSYIGIGNENWDHEYFDNLAACLRGVRQYRYRGVPTDLLQRFGITVVTTAGVDNRPQDSNENWKIINRKYRDTIVDEHVYNTYPWFIDNTARYDGYDRKGAKVFMGEYAVHSLADGRGRLNGQSDLRSALGEAAFLTGCERNSDIVKMTCYAPLFAASYRHSWTPDLIWFNAHEVMFTPSYYVQQMFAGNLGSYTLTGVAPRDSGNAGGLLLGGNRTAIAISSVAVYGRKDGKLLYLHAFENGMGGWKVCPGCIGGRIAGGELIIEAGAAFNGFYYDGQEFGDCNVEISFRRLSGEQSFIAGVGVKDVRDGGTLDCAAFSVCCQYGKNRNGFDVAFEKRVDFMRTACEMMGKDRFLGYSPEGNVMRLEYTEDRFRALLRMDGEWHEVLSKAIWKVNERVFQSATADEKGKIYLKVVNVSGKDEEMEACLINFPEKKRATMTTLCHEDPAAENRIGLQEGKEEHVVPTACTLPLEGNILRATVKNNSVNVFVIE